MTQLSSKGGSYMYFCSNKFDNLLSHFLSSSGSLRILGTTEKRTVYINVTELLAGIDP